LLGVSPVWKNNSDSIMFKRDNIQDFSSDGNEDRKAQCFMQKNLYNLLQSFTLRSASRTKNGFQVSRNTSPSACFWDNNQPLMEGIL
jgi:hypothetical protein